MLFTQVMTYIFPPLLRPTRLWWAHITSMQGWVSAVGGVCVRCSVVFGILGAPVQASVLPLQSPIPDPIDWSSLNSASPYVQGPDNQVRDKRLQELRYAAQGTRKSGAQAPQDGSLQSSDAAWVLGLLALHGLAMPADLPQAQHWFERAHVLGNPRAAAGLAWCQIIGCVTGPNPSAAMPWIAMLRRTDPGLAKYLEWHATQLTTPVSEPSAQVRKQAQLQKLLREAANAGSVQAMNELGLEYVAAGDLTLALTQFKAASAHSEVATANATLLASRINSSPETHPSSARHSAHDWYLEARRYHRGEGVPANYTEAVRLYQIAASSGDVEARKMLALIFSRPTQGGLIDTVWMQQLAAIGNSPGGILQRSPPGPTTPFGWKRAPSPLFEGVPQEWRLPAMTR